MRDCRFKTMCTDDRFSRLDSRKKKKLFALVKTSFLCRKRERTKYSSSLKPEQISRFTYLSTIDNCAENNIFFLLAAAAARHAV